MEHRIRSRLNAAQDLMKHRQYDGALRIYDSLASQNRPEIYEARALARLNANKLNEALVDARDLTRLRKREARGYLLIGRILEKRAEHKKAMSVYKKGLQEIMPRTEGAKQLEAARLNLVTRIGKIEGRDLFSFLPTDILIEILSYLELESLVSMARVSRSWRSNVRGMPWLYRTLDFSPARKTVKHNTLNDYIALAQGRLARLTLAKLSDKASSIACSQIRLQSSRKLKYVEIQCKLPRNHGLSRTLGDRFCQIQTLICGPNCPFSLHGAWEVMHRAKSLTRVEFRKVVWAPRDEREFFIDPSAVPPIEHLLLTWSSPAAWDHSLLVVCLQGLRNLRRLVLSGFSHPSFYYHSLDLEMLPYLQYCSAGSCLYITVPSSVTSLQGQKLEDGGQTPFVCGEQGLPRLLSIELDGANRSNDFEDERLFKLLEGNKHQLERLCLGYASHLDDQTQRLLDEGYLDNIRRLELTNTAHSDAFFDAVAQTCLQLTELHVAKSSQLTDAGIRSLVEKKGEPLEELNVSDSIGVGRDAIDLALSRGTRVICGSLAPQTVGRRVRYG